MRTALCMCDGAPCRRLTPQSGLMLVECLVYLSCVFAVLGAAIAVFYQVLEFSRDLRRNADDITRVLKAGERWRAEVRSAVGPLKIEEGGGGAGAAHPRSDGEVIYLLVNNGVVRCTAGNERCEVVLPAAKASRFVLEPRREVTAWRWEVELPSRLKAVRVHPLFTFTAVAATAPHP